MLTTKYSCRCVQHRECGLSLAQERSGDFDERWQKRRTGDPSVLLL